MPEPILIETYRCPVCKENLIDYTLERARAHVSVPEDWTQLPYGLFFMTQQIKEKPYYGVIIGNESKLSLDHSLLHTFNIYSFNEESGSARLRFFHIQQMTYRHLADRFRDGLGKLLSQKDFEEIFSYPKNLEVLDLGHSEPLRICPQLEAVVV